MAKRPDPSFLMIVQLHHLQAMLHLGLVADPRTGKPGRVDRDGARHELALLQILEEKTRGNLDADEEELLGEVINALTMALSAADGG